MRLHQIINFSLCAMLPIVLGMVFWTVLECYGLPFVLLALWVGFLLAFRKHLWSNRTILVDRVAMVLYWLSFSAPVIALAVRWYCLEWSDEWPDLSNLIFGTPAALAYGSWDYGFPISGCIGLSCLLDALIRHEARWIWMPLAGIILTIVFAILSRNWYAGLY
jgi:hypothetical protein